jgi:hypothetical protein
MATRLISKNFLFIVYFGQKRCHFVIYIFFLSFFSCDSTPSRAKIDIKPNQIEEPNAVVKEGEVIFYHNNGNPQSVGHFVNGVAHGPIIVYDSNGHELYRGIFKDGKPFGEWVFTNPKNNEKTIKSY